jgi:hypothetical protein
MGCVYSVGRLFLINMVESGSSVGGTVGQQEQKTDFSVQHSAIIMQI